MGINRQALAVMLHEHRYKPIVGDVLCIGKQTVNVDEDHMIKLFQENDIDDSRLRALLGKQARDYQTRHGIGSIYDHDLFKSFADCNYFCLDVSDYEGADIIQDMNMPLSDEFSSRFDFIYDGSCMDNVFDPVTFIRNCAKMLKTGGRMLLLEGATAVAGAYLQFSPEWFFSYFAINDFADCKIYATLAREPEYDRHRFLTDVFEWTPYFTRDPDYNYVEGCQSVDGLMHLIVIAEKGSASTYDKTPIQMQYLDDKCVDWRTKYADFRKCPRPVLTWKTQKDNVVLPLLTDHFRYIGSCF